MVAHFYLSPHLDDAILSCGGVIHRQVSSGDLVLIASICAGDPPQELHSAYVEWMHTKWESGAAPIAVRREEDREACERLGAGYLHLPIADAIYRMGESNKPLYDSDEAIFGPLHPSDEKLIGDLECQLQQACPKDARIYIPMAYGGHVDHCLTRLAAANLDRAKAYYRELPYAIRGKQVPESLPLPEGREELIWLNSMELAKWAEAVKDYRSQLSTFWVEEDQIQAELSAAHDRWGGIPFLFPIKRTKKD
jgi:LmbE family N-acetylglucosaminyl deacetylase